MPAARNGCPRLPPYRSLRALLYASEKELEDMELTFSVELDRYGDRVEVPLGGHAVTDKVTIENR